jgi:hypothetical protein
MYCIGINALQKHVADLLCGILNIVWGLGRQYPEPGHFIQGSEKSPFCYSGFYIFAENACRLTLTDDG